MSDLNEIIEKYGNYKPKKIIIAVNDIYSEQDPKNYLWIDCVVNNNSLKLVFSVHETIEKLINSGLNKNFFTRSRWFDIDTITNVLKLNGIEFIEKFSISKKQYFDWKLTIEEFKLLDLEIYSLSKLLNFNEKEKKHEIERLNLSNISNSQVNNNDDNNTNLNINYIDNSNYDFNNKGNDNLYGYIPDDNIYLNNNNNNYYNNTSNNSNISNDIIDMKI